MLSLAGCEKGSKDKDVHWAATSAKNMNMGNRAAYCDITGLTAPFVTKATRQDISKEKLEGFCICV